MPDVTAHGIDLHYIDSGSGSASIVFAHGLLMNHSMFEAQRQALGVRYRVLAYDHRGQGDSAPGSAYDMDCLTEDAVELIRATASAPCHFVGLSMGGFVGMRLAARYPELVRSLCLLDSSARAEPFANRLRYRVLNGLARVLGPGALVERMLPVLFGASFLSDPARAVERERWSHHLKSLPQRIVGPVAGVVSREGIESELKYIRCPTLVLVGDEDHTTPRSESEYIVANIANARLEVIAPAGHSSSIEAPAAVTAALLQFLTEVDAKREVEAVLAA